MINITLKELLNRVAELVHKENRPLRNRLDNLLLQGKVLLINDDKTPAVQTETANNEIINGARHIQPYGHYSKPPKGSETVLAKIQGNPNNVVVLIIGNRELRFEGLKDGEVAIADNAGSFIHLKNGGEMDVVAPQTINASATTVNINGSGTINLSGKNTVVNANSLTVKTKTATITAETTTINGKVNLAGGGQPIARLGDAVKVDPLTHEGTITSASTEVTAG